MHERDRARMAVTLSQQSVPRTWVEPRRPQSQPEPETRPSRRADKSPNAVRARPADPAVINNILDSFDALSTTSVIDDHLSETTSRRSRPHTANETIASAPSFGAGAPGFGVEYGNGFALDDETGVRNAALPPAVRTSRDPSGFSNYQAHRTPSFRGDEEGRRYSSSTTSRRASWRNEKDRSGKHKLSSESWVKRGSMGQELVQDDWSPDTPRTLRRKESQESLQPPKSRLELVTSLTQKSNTSRAEQIIALASTPRPGSKRRLYLTDTGSNDEQSFTDLAAAVVDTRMLEDTSKFLVEGRPVQGRGRPIHGHYHIWDGSIPYLGKIWR